MKKETVSRNTASQAYLFTYAIVIIVFLLFSLIVLELALENSKTQENNTSAEMRRPGEKNKTETGRINKSRLRDSDDQEEQCHNYITESTV